MLFYTYVLRSEKDGKLYIGWTDSLKQRLARHNEGLVVSTRNRRPLKLLYVEGCTNKVKAIAREKYFKTGYGRRYLKERI